MTHVSRIATLTCILQIATTTLTAGEFWFSVGPAYRGGMRAKTSGSSYAQTVARTQPRGDFEYPAGYPDGYFPPPPPPCLCWFYDDGFLMADSGTSDPTSPGFGLTSIWRYDNASQYDPIGETLTFHNRSAGVDGYSYELSAATVIDRPTALSDTFSGQGLESIVGVSGPSSGTVSVDLCVGVSAIWDAEAALLGVTFEEDVIQRRHTVYREYSKTAVHDVSGVTIPSVSLFCADHNALRG